MEHQMEKTRVISYEPILAGIFLKYESISFLDFGLLIEDFEKKTNIKVSDTLYLQTRDYPNKMGKYIESLQEGTIKLREAFCLDYFIREDNCTLREKLQQIVGDLYELYFKDLDIEKIREEIFTDSNIKNVLDNANVLLISDIEEDYQELVKARFKNIDYFKSIVRADNYFQKHPDELKKYHIILKGNQNVQRCCFNARVDLEDTIEIVSKANHALVTTISRYNYVNYSDLLINLEDIRNGGKWFRKEKTYQDMIKRIIENVLLNHTLERIKVEEKFAPILDYVNPNRLALPTKKKDLKILYLDSISVNKYAQDLAKYLGLNVTFLEDDNSSLGENVKRHLGDYDIIIASKMYSNTLIDMNKESTEQAKDTGRELALLVCYADHTIKLYDEDGECDYHGFGSKIDLQFAFGGNLAKDYNPQEIIFRTLRKHYPFIDEEGEFINYNENSLSCIESILGVSLNVYNDALLELSETGLTNLDLEDAKTLDSKYASIEDEEEKRKATALAPINSFDNMRSLVLSYLHYRHRGLIKKDITGLNIYEYPDNIRIENIYQGRALCAITFAREYRNNNLRVFTVETLSNKGYLREPENVGLYTQKYDNYQFIPNKPNEKQAKALESIYQKVFTLLSPVVEEARGEDKVSASKKLNYKIS